MNLSQARDNMIEQQIRPWDVLDPRVLGVLSEIPRDRFVDAGMRELAYADYQLPIGYEQCMLNPNIDGRILQSLNIATTDSVLEIGTGSGYLAACMAHLGRQVDTLERIAELSEQAGTLFKTMGLGNITTHHQDASLEWDADDSYDCIVFTGAVHAVPEFYQQKMAIGGRLFAFVGTTAEPAMEAVLLIRVSADEWITDSLFETLVPPLVNFAAPEQPFRF